LRLMALAPPATAGEVIVAFDPGRAIVLEGSA